MANSLLTVAPIFEGAGFFAIDTFLGITFTPLFILASHIFQKRNKDTEIKEENAMRKGCMVGEIDWDNYRHKLCGPFFLGSSTLNFISPYYEINLAAVGTLMRSLSHYVMRADYLPPKKSAFKKARGKLTEKLKDVNLNPLPQQVSQPSSFRYQRNLESYVQSPNV